MNAVQQIIASALPRNRRNAKGWHVFDAVCCVHNGETPDRRGRGGVLFDGNGLVYSCFNCGFKTGWNPDGPASRKFLNLAGWLGLSETDVGSAIIDVLRSGGHPEEEEPSERKSDPEVRNFPENCIPAAMAPDDIREYCLSRSLPLEKVLWTADRTDSMSRRIVIPCAFDGKIVGYVARTIDEGVRPKYLSEIPPDFTFGLDDQKPNAKFAIVAEGVLDALSVGGLAIMGNRIGSVRAGTIDSLDREIILVPDRDEAGGKPVEEALKFGWSVSFPKWEPDIKDINDATVRYGRLFVLRSILAAKRNDPLAVRIAERLR